MFEDAIPTRTAEQSKKGTSGTKVKLLTNYLRLQSEGKVFMLYQYRVDFTPNIDDTHIRKKMLHNAIREEVPGCLFDGTVLYTLKRLNPDPLEKTVMGPSKHFISFLLCTTFVSHIA